MASPLTVNDGSPRCPSECRCPGDDSVALRLVSRPLPTWDLGASNYLRKEGRKEGRKEEGRKKGRKEEGRKKGMKEEWRKEGREEWRKEGREEWRKEGRKEGRKKERTNGRKEGRRKEGRKEEMEKGGWLAPVASLSTAGSLNETSLDAANEHVLTSM